MIRQKRTPVPVVAARGTKMAYAAACLNALWAVEKGDETEVGANFERAFMHLCHLRATGRGVTLVALGRGGEMCGTVTVDFENPAGQRVAIAAGLYCAPGAPRQAALCLMMAAASEVRRRGFSHLFMTAGTKKNRTRRTYAAMGFVDTGLKAGGHEIFRASLTDVLAALEERLR